MAAFVHTHPYDIYIPDNTKAIIVGTLPPPRFSGGNLKERDVNFCYGSCDNLLWPVLGAIYNRTFIYNNSQDAVRERKEFLYEKRLGICDIVESCLRTKIDASDIGMKDIVLRDILGQLNLHPSISKILFVGGNSKNGPEYLFRKILKEKGIPIHCNSSVVPRVHTIEMDKRVVETVSLTSPSKAANRAIGSNPHYKANKKSDAAYTSLDFRIDQYKTVFPYV